MNLTVAIVAQGAMGAGVGALEEIADFVGEDKPTEQMYQAIAEFYTRIAAGNEGKHEETGALAAFLKKRD